MKNKLKRASLQIQLVIAICFIVLPVNFLLIIIGNNTVRNVEQRLMDSHENEMKILEVRLENIYKNIDADLKNALTSEWANIATVDDRETLEQQNLVNRLRALWQKDDLLEGGYLKLNRPGYVSITYNNSLMNLRQKEELGELLSETDMTQKGYNYVTLRTKSGDWYWIWNVNCNGYSFGVFAPLSEVVRLLDESISLGSSIYIVRDKVITGSNTGAGGDISAYKAGMLEFGIGENELGCRIVKLVPEEKIRSTIPVWERLMQSLPLVALVTIPVLLLVIRRMVILPMSYLNSAMKELEQDNLEYRIDENKARSGEFRYMNHTFNRMAAQISDLRIQKYETEIEKLKIETDNLRLQVNPHLLLNSLNMICNLAKLKEFQTIQKYAMSLAEYFRYALRRNEELVPLASEISFVMNYLEIQKVRFPGAFTSVYEIDETLQDMRIPPFLIQNFVENSFKYALKMGSSIEIIIVIRREGKDHAVISIVDTGNGMPEEILDKLRNGEIIHNKTGKHIGIWNIRRRLKLAYGEDYVLRLNSTEGEGTQVWIKVPVFREEEQYEFIDS
ncbi:MAG TPA: histidine kinase [Clostridiales bacterium]|nr:histidine kinase [Clostridiales bacterium]